TANSCWSAAVLRVVVVPMSFIIYFFFFNGPATTEIYTVGNTLSLHDALPISPAMIVSRHSRTVGSAVEAVAVDAHDRSEEHTSELQSLPTISYAVFCLKK